MDKKIPWSKLTAFTKFKLVFWSLTLLFLCLGTMLGCFYLSGTATIESPLMVKILAFFLALSFSCIGPGLSFMAIADTWPNEKGY